MCKGDKTLTEPLGERVNLRVLDKVYQADDGGYDAAGSSMLAAFNRVEMPCSYRLGDL